MPFGAVASIHVDIVRTPHGVEAVGWAAPAGGRLPSVLELRAGGELLAVAKATRYSPVAASQGVRFGWCGFQVGDLSVAATLADEVQLVCATDGAVRASWSAASVVHRVPGAPRPALTVPQFRAALQRAAGCTDVATILPFVLDLQRRRGDMATVVACYRWILDRTPAPTEGRTFLEALEGVDIALNSLSRLLGSSEYQSRNRMLVGPFDGSFPFGLDVFDQC